jgi:hypothetical protein
MKMMLLRCVQAAWVLTIWMIVALLVLNGLATIVGWYWPCDWTWQPFGHFNPNCSSDYGPGLGD